MFSLFLTGLSYVWKRLGIVSGDVAGNVKEIALVFLCWPDHERPKSVMTNKKLI